MPAIINILSTRPLEQAVIDEAAANDIAIDTVSFIHTERIISKELEAEIRTLYTQPVTAVFTSMNAVEAVAALNPGILPRWKVYCIGQTTAHLVREHFGEVLVPAEAQSAGELADVIVQQEGLQQVVFFCGDQRRPELPQKLQQHKINVHEIVVYRTKAVSQPIKKQYDGILFFSPSAVESFFRSNKPGHGTILFSIGETTSATIKQFSGNHVITSHKPGKELLARQAMDYFKMNRVL
jgi:uroporphyrinogen-III synthase